MPLNLPLEVEVQAGREWRKGAELRVAVAMAMAAWGVRVPRTRGVFRWRAKEKITTPIQKRSDSKANGGNLWYGTGGST